MDCLLPNLGKRLPFKDDTAEYFICKEEIEHFTDQFSAQKEFNQIIKMISTILITRSNY